MKRLSVAEAKAALMNHESVGSLREALRKAPPELDPRLAARVLKATTAGVLATRRPPRNALALLAIEGGEAALDALIAHRVRSSLKREFNSLPKVARPSVAALLAG